MKVLEHYDLNSPDLRHLTALDTFQGFRRCKLDQDGSWVLELHLTGKQVYTLAGPERKRPKTQAACDQLAHFLLSFIRGELKEDLPGGDQRVKEDLWFKDWVHLCD